MELRILGAHNYESRDTRMVSYLIDDVLALDAGSLTRSLTFEQQSRIRALILSHRHFDHTRDLLPLGLTFRHLDTTVEIYGIQDTIDFVVSNLLDTRNSPDFTKIPTPNRPAFRFHAVEFYQPFNVLDYTVTGVPVPHAVPAAGFEVSSGSTKLFYTGDAGWGLSDAWRHVSPDVLLTEVTYGNENEAYARTLGHLTPSLLGKTLEDFRAERGYLPIVIATHFNPRWEEAIRAELKEISSQLGIEILVSESDMAVKL